MKLAFCLFKYFPYGGLQRDFLRILKVCQQRQHEVHVFTSQWEGAIPKGIILHLIPISGRFNHTKLASYITKTCIKLSSTTFDIVMGFNKMPGLDIYYAADPCFQSKVSRRNWLYRYFPRTRAYLQYESAVFSHGKATKILLISPTQQPQFQHFYHTETARLHFLAPGISRDRIATSNWEKTRRDKRKDLEISDEKNLLLLIGSSFKTKGLDRAMKSLAALPLQQKQRCQLCVVGDDSSAPYLKLAKQLQITQQLHFLGGRDDIPELLLAADILIHPARRENTGTVLLEAVVAGLPVLTVENCGYAHYISTNRCGVVVAEPYHQMDFNTALQTMLCSADLAQYKTNALAFAQQADIYDLPDNAADFIETMAKQRESALTR